MKTLRVRRSSNVDGSWMSRIFGTVTSYLISSSPVIFVLEGLFL